MRLSFRAQTLLVVLLPLVLVVAALGTFTSYRYSSDVDAAHRARSAALANQMQTLAEFALFVGDFAQLESMADSLLQNDPRALRVMVRDGTGTTRLSVSRPGNLQSQSASIDMVLPVHHLRALPDPYALEPAASETPMLGSIEIRYDDGALAASRRELLLTLLTATLLAVGIGSALAVALTRTITGPVAGITLAVRQISQGDLLARAQDPISDALRPLVSGINTMAQNLEMAQNVLRWRIAEATAEMRSQRDAAERATAAKSRFLAAASHDLRQPLQAMALFVFRLRHALPEPSAQPLLRQLETAVTALQSLVGSLLDLSRIDAGAVKPVPDAIALPELLENVTERLRPLADDRGLALSWRCNVHGVVADRAMLERILGNLLSNAIKFTSSGRVLVTGRRQGEVVRIAVRDTGVGIEAASHEAVFNEFHQIGNEERNPSQGLGIGLSICRELARAMGSDIRMRSSPARGSAFWIDLPEAARVSPAFTAPGTASFEAPARVRLVVFDPVLRARMEDLLGSWGFLVIADADAGAADYAICDGDATRDDAGDALADTLATASRVIVLCDGALHLRKDSPWQHLPLVQLATQAPAGRLRAALRP